MNLIIKKSLIVTIILLFLGASLLPAASANNSKIQTLNDALFDNFIKRMMRIGHTPSLAVCIVKNGEIVYINAYGLYDIENNKTTQIGTIYQVGSIAKPVTATAMMQLIENETYGLDLDENVSKYLPFDLKNPNFPDINITFRMLLAHRASLVDYNLVSHRVYGDPDIPSYPYPFLRDLLHPDGCLYHPKIWSKDDKPGEKFYSCNVGYGIIEYLVERISGKAFNEYCKENIFYPLEMYNTSFRLHDLNTDNVAVPYEYQLMPYEYEKHKRGGIFYRQIHYGFIPHGAANLRTTLEDLSHFLIAQMNCGVYNETRILKESTVTEMQKIQYPDQPTNWGNNQYVGLGFIIQSTGDPEDIISIGHWGVPFNRMYFHPKEDTGVIIFMNSIGMPLSNDMSIMHRLNGMIMSMSINIIQNRLFEKAKNL